ncbi:MAG TPA: secretin N-terminal domain-containing protein [Lacunisphaera sp.]|nr:secretin N-terminal domain-containing protein [Lacunisphaera sp.]
MVEPFMLRDDTVDQALFLLEKWTGKIAIRPTTMPTATITINVRQRVTKAEAIQALETVLNLNGVAITPLPPRFLKVTPLNLAKSEAPELLEGSTLGLPSSGRVASKLFQLNFLRINEFMPQIGGLMNPAASSPPVVFEKANSALITDSISNLQRIETLISKLDQPLMGVVQPKFYSLQSGAKASEVVSKIRTLFNGPLQNLIGSATTYNADDRTNQIILISDPRQYAFFDELIAKLDVKSDPNTRNEVISLKHAAAKDVAPILNQLITGQNNAVRSSGQDSVRAVNSTGATPGAPPAPTTPAAPPSPTPFTAASLGLGVDATNQFSQLLTIVPEERSNSLVVSGTVDDVRLIKELVAKIDVLLAQVRIEVVIAEVTLTDNSTSGISALGLQVVDGKLVGFSSDVAGGNSITNATLTADTHDLSATIALATTPRKSNAVILSQPTISTTHNKDGKIFVGESRPMISSYLNDGTTGGGTIGTGYRSQITPRDIGIDLSVKPLIGTDGSVQMEITQEVNDILGNIVIDGNEQPRIGKRTTSSFISAKSGEIIVLGGLQRTSKTRGTSRLGPIPIIGDLLGTRTREDTRTDLIFFLRPTVLTNTEADNVPAFKQVESFPKRQRIQVEKALNIPSKP